MNYRISIILSLMIISVSLSGCTGNQSEIDDKNSEISELEERIDI